VGVAEVLGQISRGLETAGGQQRFRARQVGRRRNLLQREQRGG